MGKDSSKAPAAAHAKREAPPDKFRAPVPIAEGPNVTGYADQVAEAHKGRGAVVTDGSDNPEA